MPDRQESHSTTGFVYLVGAGPGDPGLLTLRGAECLARADLVLYDGLVNPLLLRHSHAQAERTCRAEGPTGRIIPQDEINRHLIEAARSGKIVVRLKGGDPFIFGRGSGRGGGRQLSAAGIPFEVVPGITAATAAAVYTGISLTHRDHASAVAFITGHEDPTKAAALDYAALASFPGTLVFYMGLHRLDANRPVADRFRQTFMHDARLASSVGRRSYTCNERSRGHWRTSRIWSRRLNYTLRRWSLSVTACESANRHDGLKILRCVVK